MLLQNDRIYADLGDGFLVNWSGIAHVEDTRDVYKRIVRRGSVAGSAMFTAETISACRRRLSHIVDVLAECRRMREAGHAIPE